MKNSSFEVKVGHAIGKFVHFPCLPLFLSPYLAESTVRPPKSLLPTSLRSLLNKTICNGNKCLNTPNASEDRAEWEHPLGAGDQC